MAAVLGSVAVDAAAEPIGGPNLQPTTSQLRRLARAALDEQGIAVRQLRWMGEHSNYLFRCDTTAGERLVVRVCLPDGRSGDIVEI